MVPLSSSKDEIACQFGFTTRAAPTLDNEKYIIVGRVIEGMLVVRKM